MKKFMNKKGQLAAFGQLAVGIATLAIILTVTFLVLSQATTQIGQTEGVVCTGNYSVDVPGGGGTSKACNATHELQDAVSTIPGWVPLIVIATIGAALLGLVALFRRR